MKKAILKTTALLMLIALSLGVLGACGGMKDTYYVEMKVKDFGTVVIQLDTKTAPKTVENFVSLVESGFYDGKTFHRIISNFMIQGGAPDSSSPSLKPIVGEFSANGFDNPLKHTRGTISMARTDDPDSATSQFFICNADYPSLDGKYAAFGWVVEGMDVIDNITVYGVQYTIGGIIYNEQYRPVIESMRLVDR